MLTNANPNLTKIEKQDNNDNLYLYPVHILRIFGYFHHRSAYEKAKKTVSYYPT